MLHFEASQLSLEYKQPHEPPAYDLFDPFHNYTYQINKTDQIFCSFLISYSNYLRTLNYP